MSQNTRDTQDQNRKDSARTSRGEANAPASKTARGGTEKSKDAKRNGGKNGASAKGAKSQQPRISHR